MATPSSMGARGRCGRCLLEAASWSASTNDAPHLPHQQPNKTWSQEASQWRHQSGGDTAPMPSLYSVLVARLVVKVEQKKSLVHPAGHRWSRWPPSGQREALRTNALLGTMGKMMAIAGRLRPRLHHQARHPRQMRHDAFLKATLVVVVDQRCPPSSPSIAEKNMTTGDVVMATQTAVTVDAGEYHRRQMPYLMRHLLCGWANYGRMHPSPTTSWNVDTWGLR